MTAFPVENSFVLKKKLLHNSIVYSTNEATPCK